ncbi:MAG TPA: diguanylate cyclase [Gammaproteobacteria bacterium]
MSDSEQRLAVLNEIAHIAIDEAPLSDMLQRILDALRQRFGWDFAGCAFIDWSARTFEYAAVSAIAEMTGDAKPGESHPLGEGRIGRAAESGLPVHLPDAAGQRENLATAGDRGALCIPVKHEGRVLAVLDVSSRLPELLHDQSIFLETVGELVAGAILSARRREELKQHAELMEVLSQVSRLALESDDLLQSLQQLVDYIAEVFPVEICSILLLNEAGTHFEVEAYSGSMELAVLKGGDWPITVGACGRAVREGKPQLVTDVHADPDYVPGNDKVRCEYIVPIHFRGRTLGCLNLESTNENSFTAYNLMVFRNLADQLAGELSISALNRQLAAANRSLAELSFVDHLTGIANRRRFDDVLAAECRRAARNRRPLAVLLADTDCFKQLNDHYGHDVGDECLRIIAATLREQLRDGIDLISRYGGEEFGIILPDTDVDAAFTVAEKLRQAIIDRGIEHRASPVADVATISIGVAALTPRKGMDPRMLVRLADSALYGAKRSGRNRVV